MLFGKVMSGDWGLRVFCVLGLCGELLLLLISVCVCVDC